MIAASLGLGGVFPDLRSEVNVGHGGCFPRPSIWVGVFPDLRSGLMIGAPLGLGGVFPDLRSGLMIAAPLGLGGVFPDLRSGEKISPRWRLGVFSQTCDLG